MHVPTAEELAAIAAAYLRVTAPEDEPGAVGASPWQLAARLSADDVDGVREVIPSGSRWRIAGRLDG